MKYLFALFASSLFITTLVNTSQASASFNPGRIMDDAVMADHGSMSVADIQRFLESKVTCDTWGTKPSEYGGGTRAQYAASRGWQSPPYYCMTTYAEGGQSAAQLVYDKAQKYRISPKVLIVLLQKEQGLITDEWPLYNPQYKTATGYGCPDTAPCDSQYFGLANQLDWAAKMFRSILDNSPYWYTPYILGNNYIQYNPNASCGGSTVNIQNRATQALYNYTPYQPNQAALDAGWGQAPCGAYGNRNFHLYFTSWFGSPLGGEPSIADNITITQPLSITPDGSSNEKQEYTASFTLKNKSGSTINVGWMLASVRDTAGFNLDFPLKYVSIPAYGSYTYTTSRSFQWTDNMSAYINGNLTQNIGWSTVFPKAEANVAKTTRFRVGSDVVLTSNGVKVQRIGETNEFSATATFRNRTNQDKTIGWFLLSGRDPFGANVDFPTQQITVPANGTATYSQKRSLDVSNLGKYTFFANLNDNSSGGYGWTTAYPMSNDIWTRRQSSFINGPNVIQSSPLTTSVDNTGLATATITLKNQGTSKEYVGWVILSTRKAGESTNYDFTPKELSLDGGESKTLTFKQQMVKGGDYSSNVLFNRPSGWSSSYAPTATSTYERSTTFSSVYPVKQISDTSFTSSQSKRTAAITLKNTSDNTINLGWLIVQVRGVNNTNFDFPGINVSLSPGETKTFYTTRNLNPGSYQISTIYNHPSYGWGSYAQLENNVYPQAVDFK